MGGRLPRAWAQAAARFFDRLHGRLVLLLALLLVPPTVYGANVALDAYAEQTARARTIVRQLAMLAAEQERDFFTGTERLLLFLAASPLIGAKDEAGCTAALRQALDSFPSYANIYRTDADGNIECSALPFERPLSVADRDWFRRILASGGSAIGTYQIGPVSGLPVITSAIPLRENAHLRGAFAASIRLDRIEGVARGQGLPEGGVLFLMDGRGNVLTQGKAGGGGTADLMAMPNTEDLARLNASGSADFEAEGRDGIRRVYSATPVGPGGVTMLFGMPSGSAFGWARTDLLRRVGALAVMWLVVLLGALAATDLLVTRHVHALSRVARAFSSGDFSVRPRLVAAPAEVRELGQTFSFMAERIEGRERDLTASLAEKEVLLREIHHRVKNNLQMVTSLLSLQLRAIRGEAARRAVSEVQTRVRALALVHRHLYEGTDVARVDLRLFMEELCQLVRDATTETGAPVALDVEVPHLVVPSDRAVPLALFVTEALTNSFRHAFPEGAGGRISVSLEPGGDTACLVVADDGIGMAASGGEAHAGLGLSLMRAFAKQVGGSIETAGPPGTITRLTFRVAPGAARAPRPAPAPEASAAPADPASPAAGASTASDRGHIRKIIGGARSTTSPSSATG